MQYASLAQRDGRLCNRLTSRRPTTWPHGNHGVSYVGVTSGCCSRYTVPCTSINRVCAQLVLELALQGPNPAQTVSRAAGLLSIARRLWGRLRVGVSNLCCPSTFG